MKKHLSAITLLPWLALPVSVLANEDTLTKNLNFQGFTGLFNVPSARVLDYGDFQYNFTNQLELNNPIGRFGGYEDYRSGYNNQFGFGVFPGFEIVGRNVTFDLSTGSDLSGNVKLQLPYISNETFAVALGVQDLGGAANEYDGEYVVASYRWKNLDVSLGAGSSDSSVGRMDGAFGGIEWAPFDWLTIMAEHDAGDQNAGVRFNTPRHWFGGYVQLSATGQLYSSFDSKAYDDERYYGLSLKFPLHSSEVDRSSINTPRDLPKYHMAAQFENRPVDIISEDLNLPEVGGTSGLQSLANKLADIGFEGVKVAQKGETIFVRFESAVFNRHSIDGLGVVMGMLANEAPEGVSKTQVVLMKWGVPVFKMEGELNQYRQFLNDEARLETGLVMEVSPWDIARDVNWVTAGRSPYLKARWTIRPLFTTAVGTELGVFDYSLAARHELEMAFWPGGALYTAYDIPVGNSPDFDNGKFFQYSRITEGRKHLMLSQTFVLPLNVSTQFMAGELNDNLFVWDTFSNETNIDFNTPFNFFPGQHRLKAFTGNYEEQDSGFEREVRLLSYRYYLDVINTSFEFTKGDFFYDEGWKAEASHYMGDTTFSAYVKDNDYGVRMFGLAVTVPLTARKDMSSKYWVQAKGAAQWRYQIETRTDFADKNPLAYGVTVEPTLSHGLKNTYYDVDRLNPAWVQRHSPRMREAYQRYKNTTGDWGSWSDAF